ncbi:condensation domain-containing protein [Streptomyces caelestis]|uniref:condensation domain-containing protein n=1 Tax=Streptomyces caelestis TaxID=36816 RepID=UPI00344C9F8F
MGTSGPLTFGQLSVMRAVQDLPVEQWHESNLRTLWTLPEPVPPTRAVNALRALCARHVSLRTVYDISEPTTPRQLVHEDAEPAIEVMRADGVSDAEVRALLADSAARPFTLWSEYAWRAVVLTREGMAVQVALVNHHVVADGSAKQILWEDMLTALREPDALAARKPYLLSEMAEQQRSDGFRGRLRAAERHWEKTLTTSLVDAPKPERPSGPQDEVFVARLLSRRSRTAVERVAARSGVSMFALLLAAYAQAVAEVQGVRSIPMRMVSSNRHGNPWTGHVTSMNQWVPTHVEVPAGTSVTALAQRLGLRSLQAFRNGIFDLDAIDEMCGRFPAAIASHDAVWSFNLIVKGVSGDPGSFEPFEVAEEDDGRIGYESAFLTLGPRFYLRVMDDGADAWALRLRARGVPRETAGAILRSVHETLIAEGRAPVSAGRPA